VAVLLSLILTVGAAEGQHEKTMAMSEMVDADGTKMDRDAIKHGGITHRFSTWRSRILDMVGGHADVPPEEYDLEKNYQVGHAKIAIATSGIIGKGPGNSTERDFLPQAFSDFIYAIIIEETGIFGASFVVLLYVILLWRAWRIASRCENNFPAFLMLGLTLMLVMQALFNMMVAVRLGPVTGQPLPLISKGGTSTIINCAYLGAILSVSRSAKMRKNSKEK
jgi:cell division protein FtsW